MNKDGVTTAFELIIEEIEEVANGIGEIGIKAFQEKDYGYAKSLSETGKRLKTFQERVEALLDEWQNSFDTQTRKRVEIKGIERAATQTKSKRTRLRVIFEDGSIFEEHIAADTFTGVLQRIGLSRIEQLGVTVRGLPLVGSLQSDDYQQRLVNGKYVITHSSTAEKRDILLEVSEKLGLSLRVEIVR